MPLKKLLSKDKQNIHYTAWEWAWNTGIFVGNGEVWLYKTLPTTSLVWAPENVQQQVDVKLKNVFTSIASTGKEIRWGKLASRRRFHFLTVEYLDSVDVSQEPEPLRSYLDNIIYPYLEPRKIVFLGVQLQSKFLADIASLGKGGPRDTEDSSGMFKRLYDMVGDLGDKFAKDTPEALIAYHDDLESVERDMLAHGFHNPSPSELRILQTWFQSGEGDRDGMPLIYDYPKYLQVLEVSTDDLYWEFAAVSGWQDSLDDSPWLAIANAERESANIISVRGELEKAAATRKRVRAQMRKLDETRMETHKSTEYARYEDEMLAQEMADVEAYYAVNRDEPSLANCSILLGRRLYRDENNPERWMYHNDRTYMDVLSETYSVRTVVPPWKQRECALEMTPCATVTVGNNLTFSHHLSLGLLTNSGITSWSQLGDERGAHLGYAEPDLTEVRLDFQAASGQNKPPLMAIVGKPGSGKTVVCQSLLDQASKSHVTSIMVNPKGADTLSPILSITGGEHVIIGSGTTPGTLDPYRFSTGDTATNVAMGFLTTILPGLDDIDSSKIEEGLRNAKNPECMMEAVGNIKERKFRDMITQLKNSNPIVGLCIGEEGGSFELQGKKHDTGDQAGIMLVEFASDIGLPTAPEKISEMSRTERYAVGAVSLLMQATIHTIVQSRRGQLEGGRGSFLVIDEAWIMLSSKYMTKSYLESLMRLGRSLDVTVVLATQRCSDIVNAGLTEYISRALLMRLDSQEEQSLGLEMLGLDPSNKEFRDIMASSGSSAFIDPQGNKVRLPPRAWHKDLAGNVGVIQTKLPDEVLDIYSTNPEERAALLMKMKKAMEAADE